MICGGSYATGAIVTSDYIDMCVDLLKAEFYLHTSMINEAVIWTHALCVWLLRHEAVDFNPGVFLSAGQERYISYI